MHYFLIVTKKSDGTLQAFVRNPESNAGDFLGTRTLLVDRRKTSLSLCRKARCRRLGLRAALLRSPHFRRNRRRLTFHRPSPQELRWYYPRPASTWTYRRPIPDDDGWSVDTLTDVGMRVSPIAAVMQGIVSLRSPTLRRRTSTALPSLVTAGSFSTSTSTGSRPRLRTTSAPPVRA